MKKSWNFIWVYKIFCIISPRDVYHPIFIHYPYWSKDPRITPISLKNQFGWKIINIENFVGIV